MDEHVPLAITEGLRTRGVDVLTAQEDGMRHKPDPLLLDRATALGRVLFCQDEDLLQESTARQREGRGFGGVIYSHQLALTIGQCVNELELMAKVYETSDFENRLEYLSIR
ncbi:MAG TPA: DUF5615 family PIN-like protein [Planctomycetota bacterium]|jgi:hypothetical protein